MMNIKLLTTTLLLQAFFSSAFGMSEEKEIELGREEHKKIISQYGVYRDKKLQDYVTMVGERVAKVSSRPNLEYTFTVLNDDTSVGRKKQDSKEPTDN